MRCNRKWRNSSASNSNASRPPISRRSTRWSGGGNSISTLSKRHFAPVIRRSPSGARQEQQDADSLYREQVTQADQTFEADRRRLQAALGHYADKRQQTQESAVQQMATAWNESLQTLAVAQAAAQETNRSLFLPWKSLGTDAWHPPMHVPPGIRIGRYAVDLASLPAGLPTDPSLAPPESTFPFPAILPFPNGASLLMKTDGPPSRRAALQAMQVYLLRMLTLLPPGKLRLTIFDPVGLGESFSGLMHLADFDELLITSRIWTETAHIEARLADLTEHMENVLQKYLRNEFASIEAYNDFAGEVAEPYHVLVVADFPEQDQRAGGPPTDEHRDERPPLRRLPADVGRPETADAARLSPRRRRSLRDDAGLA